MSKRNAPRILICLFLFLSFEVIGQSELNDKLFFTNLNPETGSPSDYIVTSSGVKVFGKIESKYDEATYRSIDFNVNGSIKTYYPADLKAFGLANSRFFKSKVLPNDSTLSLVQVLVSGTLELDFFNNKYFIDNGTEMIELRAFYTQGSIDGNKLKRYVKAYISTLKIEMAGECGSKLNDQIETAKMEELDFVRLFEAYHECNGLPYTSHISSVSFLKVSPIFAFGLGYTTIKDRAVEEGQNNSLKGNISYRFQGGLRLHEFRKFPRISFDVRVGMEVLNTTFQSEFESPQVVIIKAEEVYKETSVFIPIGINYSIYRKSDLDVYLGLTGAAWFSKISSKSSRITEEIFSSGRTNVYDRQVLTVIERLFVPGLKIGAKFPVGERMKVFSELQGDLLQDYYTSVILAKRSSFNRTGLSLQVGIEF